MNPPRGWKAIRRESFLRLVLFRGFFQCGFLAAALFILLSAMRGDVNLFDHSLRALLLFPLGGLVFGVILWGFGRLFGNGASE